MQKVNIKLNKIALKQNVRAFAMMESLVAISILLTTIVAPLTLSIQSLKYTRLANDRTLASYIASQTVEFANNYRQELRLVCTNDLAGTITNCAGDPSKSSLQIFIGSFGTYDMTGLPANTVKNLNCSLYQNPTSKEYTCEVATSSVANLKTVYKRALVVSGNDSFTYAGGGSGYNITAKVISIICYGKALTCDENTKDSVKVYSYIY